MSVEATNGIPTIMPHPSRHGGDRDCFACRTPDWSLTSSTGRQIGFAYRKITIVCYECRGFRTCGIVMSVGDSPGHNRRVAVIGLGYVGLPVAAAFARD